jgi:RNA recognition motif-containing protein
MPLLANSHLSHQYNRLRNVLLCMCLSSLVLPLTDFFPLSGCLTERRLYNLLYSYHRYDPHTKESRRFAFVDFDDVACADAARQALHGAEIDGRTISVEKVSFSKCHFENSDVFLSIWLTF